MKKMTLILGLLLIQFTFAQNTQDAVAVVQGELGFGARAISMGGAYTALADDYSALYWNPAGLAGITHSQFMGELSHQTFNNKAAFYGNTTDESWSFTRLQSLGFVIPLPTVRGSAVLAVGFNRVHDLDHNLIFSGINSQSNGLSFYENVNDNDVEFPFDEDIYQQENVTNEGSMKQWSIGGAMALSPNVNVGISLDFLYGKTDYQWDFYQEDDMNIYNVYPGDYFSYQLVRSMETEYSAFGAKLGGTFKILPSLQFGLNMGLPVTYNVTENYSENDNLVYDDGYEDPISYEPGQYEYKIKLPYYFDAGVGFTSRNLTLGAGVRYRDWSQIRFEIAEGDNMSEDNSELLAQNNDIRSSLEATINYHVGGELFLENLNTKIRAGYALKPAPYKNMDSDADRTYISGGIGFIMDRYVTLDLAAVRSSWTQVSEDSYTPGGTSEDITRTKIFLGIKYNF